MSNLKADGNKTKKEGHPKLLLSVRPLKKLIEVGRCASRKRA